MDFSLITGGAIISGIIGFWGQIKSFIWSLISIVIQKADITTEEAHNAIIAYLSSEYKYLGVYNKVFGANNETFKTGKYGLVPYELFGQKSIIFFNKSSKLRYPFLLSVNKEQQKNNTEGERYSEENSQSKVFSSILYLRGTLDVSQIMKLAIDKRNKISWKIDNDEEHTNRFEIFYLPDKNTDNQSYFSKQKDGLVWYKQSQYKLLGISKDSLGREKVTNGHALDNLFFPDNVRNLIKSIELWVKSENWYKSKNIPWKRGWLLYGPPGTGKTALVRAFAEDLDLPIYVFSLSQMSNADLIQCWKNLQLNIPCIALIEDIDNVFDKRTNICQKGMSFSFLQNQETAENDIKSEKKYTPLTFDCFINCLDGIDRSSGVFTIITTNDINKIDNALGKDSNNGEFVSTRPGRIDKVIKLTYMESENKIKMANKLLAEFPDKLKEVKMHIKEEKEETPAQFQEYCAQIAIEEHWRREDKNDCNGM
ncbi:hypothetical protein LPYR103PRE_21630 [Segatella asaccharophila]